MKKLKISLTLLLLNTCICYSQPPPIQYNKGTLTVVTYHYSSRIFEKPTEIMQIKELILYPNGNVEINCISKDGLFELYLTMYEQTYDKRPKYYDQKGLKYTNFSDTLSEKYFIGFLSEPIKNTDAGIALFLEDYK